MECGFKRCARSEWSWKHRQSKGESFFLQFGRTRVEPHLPRLQTDRPSKECANKFEREIMHRRQVRFLGVHDGSPPSPDVTLSQGPSCTRRGAAYVPRHSVPQSFHRQLLQARQLLHSSIDNVWSEHAKRDMDRAQTLSAAMAVAPTGASPHRITTYRSACRLVTPQHA